MVVGFAHWPLLAEVARLLCRGIDAARENDLDTWPACAHPSRERKGVLRTGGVGIGQNHVNRQSVTALREKLSRLIEISCLHDPVAALTEIFRERVPNENVGIDNQDAGRSWPHEPIRLFFPLQEALN